MSKNRSYYRFIGWLLFLFFIPLANAQIQVKERPSDPKMAVNDFGYFLTEAERMTLELNLRNYYDSTTNEFVVITLDSIGAGNLVSDIAMAYAKAWKPGNVEKSNAIIFLLAKKERKIRIELGKGMEQYFSNDAIAKILEGYFVPALKEGKYFNALLDGIEIIKQEIKTQSAIKN